MDQGEVDLKRMAEYGGGHRIMPGSGVVEAVEVQCDQVGGLARFQGADGPVVMQAGQFVNRRRAMAGL